MTAHWANSAFDPETIDALAAALDRACRLAAAEARGQFDLDWARNILAERIRDMARQGERDRARLALGALCHLRQTEQIRASKERTARRESLHGFRQTA
jgi:hypothetical protein